MRIRTVIDKEYRETELHICSGKYDGDVQKLEAALHNLFDSTINASDEYGNVIALKPGDAVSFFASGQKVYAMVGDRQYPVSKKLYELEAELESGGFTRISKSEIINCRMIKCLDMSMTGTIKLTMKNGYETYTSRRNVAKIKELLIKRNER